VRGKSASFGIGAPNATQCPLMCLFGSSSASRRSMPANDVLEQHARHILKGVLTNKALNGEGVP